MTRIEITGVTGTTPIEVYGTDYYGNNRFFLGTINSEVPPSVYFDLPDEFNGVPLVNIILIDSNGCELAEKTVCTT
jgi:hypothetical protein